MSKQDKNQVALLKTWMLPPAATMGSFVRMKGLLLEIRARLPHTVKKSLDLDDRELVLTMSANEQAEFEATTAIVAEAGKYRGASGDSA